MLKGTTASGQESPLSPREIMEHYNIVDYEATQETVQAQTKCAMCDNIIREGERICDDNYGEIFHSACIRGDICREVFEAGLLIRDTSQREIE